VSNLFISLVVGGNMLLLHGSMTQEEIGVSFLLKKKPDEYVSLFLSSNEAT